ncbi:MAG: hypothetical protein FJ276_09345 [Planctomycetes bacterium]|nr:hypothetical protein [Planctomycetota bacterium]
MNRVKKFGGAVALPIASYVKPEGATTYEDWQRDDAAAPIIAEGLARLRSTRNCSAVADWFNQQGFPVGPYCRRSIWNGPMVRRYYRNRLLAGCPGRGFRHCVKRHETGRRISVINPDGPIFIEVPHLAHVDAVELDEVNALLDRDNADLRRKPVHNVGPLFRQPRKRTRFPGQHARCWYCGRQYVWGGNGMTDNSMCSGTREWHCWNSIGFPGRLAAERLVQAITGELYQLQGFESQFAEMVAATTEQLQTNTAQQWERLHRNEEKLAREMEHLADAIAKLGARPLLANKLSELEDRQKALLAVRYRLERPTRHPLQLPATVGELRESLEIQFQELATDSPEFGDLLRLLVPQFEVYLVRLCDVQSLVPHVRGGSVPVQHGLVESCLGVSAEAAWRRPIAPAGHDVPRDSLALSHFAEHRMGAIGAHSRLESTMRVVAASIR